MGFLSSAAARLGLSRTPPPPPPAPPVEPRQDASEPTLLDEYDLSQRAEGWANPFTRMGFGSRDPKVATTWIRRFTLTRYDQQALYASGIGRRIINLAVNDASRKGYEIVTEAEPDLGLAVKMALGNLPLTTSRLQLSRGALRGFNRAEKWARVYGGAAIILMLEDGNEPDEPLDVERLEAITGAIVLSRHSLQAKSRFDDPTRPTFGTVETWELLPTIDTTNLPLEQRTIHSSRMLLFDGEELPPDDTTSRSTSTRNISGVGSTIGGGDSGDGWGISLFDVIYNELRASGIAEGTGDALVQRSTFGIWSVSNLFAAIKAGAESKLYDRIAIQSQALSALRVLLMDGRAEDFQTISFDYSGIATMLDRNPRRVSAVSGYPISLLYGTEEGGLNTGSHVGDRNNYHEGTVHAGIQEDKWRANLERLIELQMWAMSNSGAITSPEPFELIWNPLVALTEAEIIEMRHKQAQTDVMYLDTGVLTPGEVRESRFASAGINLDTTLSEEPPPQPEPMAA